MPKLTARSRALLAAAALSSAALFATPATAAVNICSGSNCVKTDENVLVNSATNVAIGSQITGTTNNTGQGVVFTSTTDRLNAGANGQAVITSASDSLLNNLTFALTNGATFTSAVFNLTAAPGNVANEATSAILTYVLNGVTGTRTISLNTNGQNFYGVSADAGELFTSITFTGNPASTGIGSFEQLRLGGVQAAVAAVPEPSTWALMLLGFGAVGFSMRRGRRATPRLVSIA